MNLSYCSACLRLTFSCELLFEKGMFMTEHICIMFVFQRSELHGKTQVLGIPTLKYRRCRGDMIETFKILHGIYDTAVAPVLPICQEFVTRGHSCILVKSFYMMCEAKGMFR